MSNEPESIVQQFLRGIRAGITGLDHKIDLVDAGIVSLQIEVEVKIARLEKETREQISGLRRAVIEYHSSVVGHNILISELEARMRRVEQHLNLPALGSHRGRAGIT